MSIKREEYVGLLVILFLGLPALAANALGSTAFGAIEDWLWPETISVELPIGWPLRMAAADFTADGYVDLVLVVEHKGDPPVSKIVLVPGTGVSGAFGEPVVVAAEQLQPGLWGGFSPLLVADLDADGHLDLITVLQTIAVTLEPSDGLETLKVSTLTSALVFLYGDATGRFHEDRLEIELGFFTFSRMVVADFNGDGFADLAFPSPQHLRVGLLLGDGRRGFRGPQYVSLHETRAQKACLAVPVRIGIGDFDANGTLDIAVLGFCQESPTVYRRFVQVLLGDGTGGFREGPIYIVGYPERTLNIVDFLVGDFNRDGNLDLIATRRADPQREDELTLPMRREDIVLIPGQGNGTFGSPRILAGIGPSYGLQFSYVVLDKEGVLMIVAMDEFEGIQVIYSDLKYPGYLSIPLPSTALSLGGSVVVDLDNDGILEIVGACSVRDADRTQLILWKRRSQ